MMNWDETFRLALWTVAWVALGGVLLTVVVGPLLFRSTLEPSVAVVAVTVLLVAAGTLAAVRHRARR